MLNKFKQKLLFLATISFIIAGNAACNDDNYNNSLVGTWYEVGSTKNKGVNVVFTKTNVSVYHYFKDYKTSDSLFNDTIILYDNLKYYILPNDKIQLYHFPNNEKNDIILTKELSN